MPVPHDVVAGSRNLEVNLCHMLVVGTGKELDSSAGTGHRFTRIEGIGVGVRLVSTGNGRGARGFKITIANRNSLQEPRGEVQGIEIRRCLLLLLVRCIYH
jgi:hypothetical protein